MVAAAAAAAALTRFRPDPMLVEALLRCVARAEGAGGGVDAAACTKRGCRHAGGDTGGKDSDLTTPALAGVRI